MGPSTTFYRWLTWGSEVSDLSEVTGLIMAAAGEHSSPGLQTESLFRTHRAAGLLPVCSRCAQRCSCFFARFWSPKELSRSIQGHTHFPRQVGSYPTCFLNISFEWRSWAPSVRVARMFRVPVFCSGSQEPTFSLESSAVNDTLTALPFFIPFSLTIQI